MTNQQTFGSHCLVATMLLASLGLTACSKPVPPSSAPSVVSGIHVYPVSAQQVQDTVAAVGTVQAVESAALAAQVTGTVLTVAVKEGDPVHTGQTLISIDGAQFHSDLERAHAAVSASERAVAASESDSALAASTLQRYQILQERKSISPQEFDEIRTHAQSAASRVEVSRAQAAEARAAENSASTMLSYTRIRAPFDGIVVARKADPGTLATPGTPLLVVDKKGRLQLEVTVDESLLSTVHLGANIPVLIDALSQSSGAGQITGRVSRIVPAAESGSHSFLVKLDLPPTANLRSGMYGRAQFSKGVRSTLTIPRSAVLHRGSLQEVYVVGENHIAGLRYVTLGVSQGDSVEVLSGLSSGERVIDAPGGLELDGKRIEEQP